MVLCRVVHSWIMSSSLIAVKARQRASVKWILSKAFNNRVPENQREPFYRDHEGQEHLKPQVSFMLKQASHFDNIALRQHCLCPISMCHCLCFFFFSNKKFTVFHEQIVVGLGNASIYCQTLSNLYSDPNYQSLNHWSILQTLTRKGVPITENPDMPLTETVLIQTNPLRIVSLNLYFTFVSFSFSQHEKFYCHIIT